MGSGARIGKLTGIKNTYEQCENDVTKNVVGSSQSSTSSGKERRPDKKATESGGGENKACDAKPIVVYCNLIIPSQKLKECADLMELAMKTEPPKVPTNPSKEHDTFAAKVVVDPHEFGKSCRMLKGIKVKNDTADFNNPKKIGNTL